MTITQLYALRDAILNDSAIEMATTITGSPSTYGLTAPMATAMSDASDLFNTALQDWNIAQIQAESTHFIKEQRREELLSTFAQYLNLMYATPSVSEATITTLGLEPRSTARSEIVPSTPVDLIATPFADGTAKLKWKKGDNKYGVIYQVEIAEADASSWNLLASTTKTSLTVGSMTPGTPRWFRVKAIKNGDESEYSYLAGIYIPSSGGQGIHIAA